MRLTSLCYFTSGVSENDRVRRFRLTFNCPAWFPQQ
jgi:hypothetical protein